MLSQFLKNAGPIYLVISIVIGAVGALGIFAATWFFGADQFGVWAFLFGWLPAAILAFVGFYLVGLLWPIAVGWLIWRWVEANV